MRENIRQAFQVLPEQNNPSQDNGLVPLTIGCYTCTVLIKLQFFTSFIHTSYILSVVLLQFFHFIHSY